MKKTVVYVSADIVGKKVLTIILIIQYHTRRTAYSQSGNAVNDINWFGSNKTQLASLRNTIEQNLQLALAISSRHLQLASVGHVQGSRRGAFEASTMAFPSTSSSITSSQDIPEVKSSVVILFFFFLMLKGNGNGQVLFSKLNFQR